MARRGTFGVAATLSLGFFLLYWASLIGGEKLGDRGIMPPWLGMWMANIFLGIIGLVLTLRLTKEIPVIAIMHRHKYKARFSPPFDLLDILFIVNIPAFL